MLGPVTVNVTEAALSTQLPKETNTSLPRWVPDRPVPPVITPLTKLAGQVIVVPVAVSLMVTAGLESGPPKEPPGLTLKTTSVASAGAAPAPAMSAATAPKMRILPARFRIVMSASCVVAGRTSPILGV